MSLTLYVDDLWISPYAFSAFVALEEKGLDYRVETVALGDDAHKTAAYVALSRTARIPALQHDDFGLAESSAIVEYIDEVFPGVRLLPEAPRERARARQIMSWLRSDLPALREERPTTTMFFERATRPLSARAQMSADKLVRVTEGLLVGDDAQTAIASDWCIADADLAFALHRLILNGDPVPSRVQRYAKAQWARPSIMKFVTMPRPGAVK